MAIPLVMADLSVTPSNNSPAGSESPISTDDFHRAIQAILRTTNAKGADIASATTTNIGAATAEFVDVTGTTTITGFGTIAAGIVRTVRFTGILTLTHNATSLILPNASNITTNAGDIGIFRSLGSGNWVCVAYSRKNVNPVDGAAVNIASATTVDLTAATGNVVVITGTTAVEAFTMNAGQVMYLVADGALPLTYHATTMNIQGGASYTCAAGDRLIVFKDIDNIIRVNVFKQDGTAVVAPSVSGTLIGTQYFTASGDYDKTVNNPSFIIVEVVGGGSGGRSVGNSQGGGGGAAGGYSKKRIDFASLSTPETVTIGAGGAANTAGGTSSFGAHCSATGGGAPAAAGGVSAGGTGGIGSGGDFNLDGGDGWAASTQASGMGGGSSVFGGAGAGGAASGTTTRTQPTAAKANTGSGGGGGTSGSSSTATGGAGADGIVIVWEYA